ncbi:MAG: DUF465 domain-containing protein [Spirochaetes bacterium]|nr:DUF465 domain-containing protein [Spirochaetota bacterium]MBX3724273.1 DUF465 domain-containing protein [Turneriella sp.]
MIEKHHDLHHEFPEYREKIISLKTSDRHFHKLAEEYDAMTHEIEKQEQAGSVQTDAHMEELKKKRLALKDQIFHALKAG